MQITRQHVFYKYISKIKSKISFNRFLRSTEVKCEIINDFEKNHKQYNSFLLYDDSEKTKLDTNKLLACIFQKYTKNFFHQVLKEQQQKNWIPFSRYIISKYELSRQTCSGHQNWYTCTLDHKKHIYNIHIIFSCSHINPDTHFQYIKHYLAYAHFEPKPLLEI